MSNAGRVIQTVERKGGEVLPALRVKCKALGGKVKPSKFS